MIAAATGWNKTGSAVSIGLPAFLFVIALSTSIWFMLEVKKRNLRIRALVVWIVINTIYTIILGYIMVVAIMQVYYDFIPNVFALAAYYVFGFTYAEEMGWVYIWIFSFITFILIMTLRNAIKISVIASDMDRLNEEVGILKGMINKTADFDTKDIYVPRRDFNTTKAALRDDIKISKAEYRANKKLDKLKEKSSKKK